MASSSLPSIRLSACVCLFLSLCLALLLNHAVAEDAPAPDAPAGSPATDAPAATSPTPLPDNKTLRKMKVAQLKAMLAQKGPDAACLACTSKAEYIDRIRETADWPDATPSPAADDPSAEELQRMFANQKDSPDLEELRKKLEGAGLGGMKVFTKDDLAKMGDLDQFKNVKTGDASADAAADPKADESVKTEL